MAIESQYVLIADDEGAFVASLAERLTVAGNIVHTADNPERAVALAQTRLPRLIVLEPNQPGMSWVRFMRAIRAACPSARMIVATAFGSTAMMEEAVALNAQCFLEKPANASLVLESSNILALTMPSPSFGDDRTLEQHEWEYLNLVLRRCSGNISETSRRLGVPRQTLYYKLRKRPQRQPVVAEAETGRPPAQSRKTLRLWCSS